MGKAEPGLSERDPVALVRNPSSHSVKTEELKPSAYYLCTLPNAY